MREKRAATHLGTSVAASRCSSRPQLQTPPAAALQSCLMLLRIRRVYMHLKAVAWLESMSQVMLLVRAWRCCLQVRQTPQRPRCPMRAAAFAAATALPGLLVMFAALWLSPRTILATCGAGICISSGRRAGRHGGIAFLGFCNLTVVCLQISTSATEPGAPKQLQKCTVHLGACRQLALTDLGQ